MANQTDIVEIEMPDGTVLEFPSSMSDQQMQAAAQNYFAQQSGMQQKEPQSLGQKAFRYGVKDPNVGFSKLARNVADTVPWLLNTALDIPSSAYNIGAKALGSESRMHLGHQPGGGATFPYTGITNEDINEFYNMPPEEKQNWIDKLIQFGPDVAGMLVAPEAQISQRARALESAQKLAPATTKAADKAINTAISQGGYGLAASPAKSKAEGAMIQGALGAPLAGASKYAQNTPGPILRNLLGTTVGGITGGMGYEAASEMDVPPFLSIPMATLLGYGARRGIISPEGKMAEMVQGIDLSNPETQAMLEASKRLNVPRTPAETTKDPWLGAKESELSRAGRKSQKASYDASFENIKKEDAAISRLLEKIFPEGSADLVDQGYKNAWPERVDYNLKSKYGKEPVIKNAFKVLEADETVMAQAKSDGLTTTLPGGKKEVLDRNKLGSWDLIKRYLDAEVKTTTGPNATSIQKFKSRNFKDVRDGLRGALEKESEQYRQAKSLSERGMARESIEKAFKKSGDQSDTGQDLYKLLRDRPTYEELQMHLRDIPEAQLMLDDMRKIFYESRQVPKVKTAKGRSETGMDQMRNSGKQLMQSFLNLFQGDSMSAEAIEFINSGKWAQEVERLNKVSDMQKRAAMMVDLLGRIGATGARETVEANIND